jgi:CRISPR-associated protein Csd1
LAAEDPSRASLRHADFVALTHACAQVTGSREVRAVLTFLQSLPNEELSRPAELKHNHFITFEVDGVYPIDDGAIQMFWTRVAPHIGEKGVPSLTAELVMSWLDTTAISTVMQCIVCGENKPIARIHPIAIKLPRSVSDQQLALVSANKGKDAFYSYGLEQSFIAPTCRPCASAYAQALNRIVRDERQRLVLGNAIYLFWTREKVDFDPNEFFSQPKASQVRALRESVRNGKREDNVDDTAFYAVMLSGSGARVVVRDWINTTIGSAKQQMARWFELQDIVSEYGGRGEPLSINSLASATVRRTKEGRPDFDNLPTFTLYALLQAALTTSSLSLSLLHQAVDRCRAEREVSRHRAALIKLVLLSQELQAQEGTMVDLDQNHPDLAYHCGRLLAVLANIQEKAIGREILVERFYGTASSAPMSVYWTLIRGAQPHLAKLKRDKKPTGMALERRLEEVMSMLSTFPATLTPIQQGLFALGFYHQRAYDRAQAQANAARKQAAAITDNNDLFSNDETV